MEKIADIASTAYTRGSQLFAKNGLEKVYTCESICVIWCNFAMLHQKLQWTTRVNSSYCSTCWADVIVLTRQTYLSHFCFYNNEKLVTVVRTTLPGTQHQQIRSAYLSNENTLVCSDRFEQVKA